MRSRSRVRSLFVPLAIVGVLGAASVASAGTDTTTPEDTAAAGTEPAGTEPAGTEPAGRSAGAGAGAALTPRPRGFDLAGTTVTVFGVETADEGPALQVALNEFADANGMTITYSGSRGFEGEVGTMIAGRQPARHRHVPAARPSSPATRRAATPCPCPTTSRPPPTRTSPSPCWRAT